MKRDWKAIGKKWLRRTGGLLVATLIFLIFLEIFYRYQWIDTYQKELQALNSAPAPAQPRKKVLAMGDSFTAATNSWVDILRRRHPDVQFINSAVPGTTILQANLMLKRRLAAYKPDLLVYQIYVGNDLFDLRYPTNWAQIGWGRNLYWMAANRFRSLAWVNYALGQFKRAAQVPDFAQGKEMEGEFDPAKYSERERLYLRAEPNLIADQVLLQGDRGEDMEDYLAELKEFLATAHAANVPVIVLVVPHSAQVHPQYAMRMKMIGATGMNAPNLASEEFPFYNTIKGLQQDGATFFNLLPLLAHSESSGLSMYYLHDGHLNDAGQALVADVVDSLAGL